MKDMPPRSSENSTKVPLRSDRYFRVNTQWFFTTREGPDVGPYNTKEEAVEGLNAFIEFMNVAPEETKIKFISTYSFG